MADQGRSDFYVVECKPRWLNAIWFVTIERGKSCDTISFVKLNYVLYTTELKNDWTRLQVALPKGNILLVSWTEIHLSSFKSGFLNIFSHQNLLHSFSRLLFLLRSNKYGARNYIPFDFWDDSTLANQGAGKTIKKPWKELPWNQQIPTFSVLFHNILMQVINGSLQFGYRKRMKKNSRKLTLSSMSTCWTLKFTRNLCLILNARIQTKL